MVVLDFIGIFPKRRTLQQRPDFIWSPGYGYLEFTVDSSCWGGDRAVPTFRVKGHRLHFLMRILSDGIREDRRSYWGCLGQHQLPQAVMDEDRTKASVFLLSRSPESSISLWRAFWQPRFGASSKGPDITSAHLFCFHCGSLLRVLAQIREENTVALLSVALVSAVSGRSAMVPSIT